MLKEATTKALVHAVEEVAKSDKLRQKHEDTVLSKTQSIVQVAIEIGSLEQWDEYRAELDRLARVDKKAAERMGYETVEVDRNGNKTLVTQPVQTLKNIFSVIRVSFKLAVPLKDGRGEPRPFNAIKSDKAKAAAKAKKAKMSPKDQQLARLQDIYNTLWIRAKAIDDAKDLAALVDRVEAEALAWFPIPSEKKAA